MTEMDMRQKRRLARRYWDEHSIADVPEEELENVESEPRKLRSAMLSIRLEADCLNKLKAVAKSRGVGISTLARMLLEETLDNPRRQYLLHALDEPIVKQAMGEMVEDAKIPCGDQPAAYYIISHDELERISALIERTASRLFIEGFERRSIEVRPSEGELYRGIQKQHQIALG